MASELPDAEKKGNVTMKQITTASIISALVSEFDGAADPVYSALLDAVRVALIAAESTPLPPTGVRNRIDKLVKSGMDRQTATSQSEIEFRGQALLAAASIAESKFWATHNTI
jgi:hypothetical protein